MRKQLLTLLLVALFAIPLSTAPHVGSQNVAAQGATRETQPVYTTPDGFLLGSPVPGALANLVRGQNGITTNVQTAVAVPGAYTVWWIVFNHPAACATYLCTFDEPDLISYAAGHIVSPGGSANLSGSLRVGGARGEVIYEGPDPDLTNPGGALITLVVRYHGPALAGMIPQQISTFLGGCPPGGGLSCQDVQLVVFPGNECTGACADPTALP